MQALMARAMAAAGVTPAAHSRRHVAGARVRRPPRAAVPSTAAFATWRSGHARAMSAAAAPINATPTSRRAATAAVATPAPTAVRLPSPGCSPYVSTPELPPCHACTSPTLALGFPASPLLRAYVTDLPVVGWRMHEQAYVHLPFCK